MTQTQDAFARSTASRAWRTVRDLEEQMDKLNKRLVVAELQLRRVKTMRECAWCGAPSVGPACRAHSDLLIADAFAPSLEVGVVSD